MLWQSDEELFRIVKKELFTCVVGDVMDKMGLQHQFLPPQIRPLNPDMVLIGRAMPVLSVDVFEEKITGTANKLMAKPFGLMLEALDGLLPNEVYVNTGSSPRNALWGELMTVRAKKLGATGAVLKGYVRDTKAILKTGFPTFSFGSYGQDSAPPLQGGRLSCSRRDWCGSLSSGRFALWRHRWCMYDSGGSRNRSIHQSSREGSRRKTGQESVEVGNECRGCF
jgi:regulator of ribonuclease E activity RraA/HMG-CHA aldolase family protein